jgi:hypothetical protein
MSRSTRKVKKTIINIGPLPRSTGFENPCPITSITDLTPEKVCDCAKQLLQQLSNIKAMLQNPENVVTSIWPSDPFLYGPVSIGSSPGWWFRVHKPELSIDNGKLNVGLKCGVKKTRGVLQFTWREAGHTFAINIPNEISQYNQAITEIANMENSLNTLVQNICQFVP